MNNNDKLKKKLKEEADLVAGSAIGDLLVKGLSSLFDDDKDDNDITDIDVDIDFDDSTVDSSDDKDDDFGGGDFGGGGASSDW